ncbi:DUF2783 domain-containing protein [Novosphingobium jiangmenense]|uniref:DUF2783 domain-containing protein n=1 Tax=Novosphingobium jiangmenense TaxID=2791981 RepID=A0ABS0HHI5_9SPHN|nr:DUF2783 domain-containing protein [Novosphingobium jiangmenense]
MSEANILSTADADTIYAQLIDLHRGRSDAESLRLNARLILLLINQISDVETVLKLIASAEFDTMTGEIAS